MKIAIMQPYVFPYIGYFQLIKDVDLFVIFDDVNFIKKGWINRNNLLSNGTAIRFTVPLKSASQNKLIRDTIVNDESEWRDDLLKTITHSYKKAPYFESVFPVVQKILDNPENNIAYFNFLSLKEISSYLDLNTNFILSSQIEKDLSKKGSEKIIEICKSLKATVYVNAIGGIDLYSKESFDKENITLHFLKTNNIEYKQFDNDFVPWLSIIDILMFNSKEKTIQLLNEYTLI